MKQLSSLITCLLTICLIASLVSCKKTSKTSDKPIVVKPSWEVSVKKSYAVDEKVVIRFKNISEKAITIYDPLMIVVEQKIVKETLNKEDSKTEWKQVRWLYCPCGASCPPPPRTMDIVKDQSKTFVWNKIEKWCDNQGKTVQQKAPKGTYRLKMTYKAPKTGEKEVYYQEFSIE